MQHPTSSLRRRLRVVVRGGLLLLLALSAAGCVAKRLWDRGYYDGYDSSLPLSVADRGEEARAGYRRVAFSFQGLPGQTVPALLALPPTGGGPFPCVVFLHGIGQHKGFLDEIATPFTQRGFAIVSFDQLTRGERRERGAGIWRQAVTFRRRPAWTVIETRRLLDCLQARADLAPDRLYLAGASYGAITGTTAAAFDPRLRAVALIYGGGDMAKLLDNPTYRDQLGWVYHPAVWLGRCLMSPADPLPYVGRISPRPVLLLNGTHDRLIPTPAAQALQDAAREPKSAVWYDSDHVGLEPVHTAAVLEAVVAWLVERDAEVRAAANAGPATATPPPK